MLWHSIKGTNVRYKSYNKSKDKDLLKWEIRRQFIYKLFKIFNILKLKFMD